MSASVSLRAITMCVYAWFMTSFFFAFTSYSSNLYFHYFITAHRTVTIYHDGQQLEMWLWTLWRFSLLRSSPPQRRCRLPRSTSTTLAVANDADTADSATQFMIFKIVCLTVTLIKGFTSAADYNQPNPTLFSPSFFWSISTQRWSFNFISLPGWCPAVLFHIVEQFPAFCHRCVWPMYLCIRVS